MDGLGGKAQGVPREDGFEITVASEIMAVLCLSTSITDLKEKLGRMIVAYTYDGKPVTAHDLKAEGAMAALLKDALKPNLVQTLEGTPAFIHGGPFANIAHGCNSVIATRMALKLGDYAVTEAGFAADLGAEKFIDIKCRKAGLKPSAVVIVATVRALKYHGGVPKPELNQENLEALEKGLPNLLQHVDNVKNVYGLPCVVAINAFPTDTKAELDLVERKCNELGVNVALSEVWAKGGEGGKALAEEVIRLCEQPSHFQFVYDTQASIQEKLDTIVKKVYHGERRGAHRQRQEAGPAAHRPGLRRPAHLHGQDPVLLLRRPDPAGRAQRLRGHGAQSEGLRRRRLHRGSHRRYHDHARPAQSPLCREDRRRRERQDHRPVLSRAWAFGCGSTPPLVRRKSEAQRRISAGRIYFARGSKKTGPPPNQNSVGSHARPAQSPLCREDRRRRERQDHRPVLSI